MNAFYSTSLELFIKVTKQKLLLPFYHLVADTSPDYTKHLYPVRTIKDFKQDLEVFLKHYQPVSLQTLIKLVQENKQYNKKYVHLTFDDGLSNFYDIVAPILREKNIPATVFINTDFIDNKELFYRYKASLLIEKYEQSSEQEKKIIKVFFKNIAKNFVDVKTSLLSIKFSNRHLLDELAILVNVDFKCFLATEKPYLTTQQIKLLIDDGFTIGAHSKNHPLFNEITEQEQLLQFKESIGFLTQKFLLDYKAFSFPFTDLGVKKSFFKTIINQQLVDISFGISGMKQDELSSNFQRIIFENASKNTTLFLLKKYVKYMLKRLLNKHKMPRE